MSLKFSKGEMKTCISGEVLMLFNTNHHMSDTVISISHLGYLVCKHSQSNCLQVSVHILDPDQFIF